MATSDVDRLSRALLRALLVVLAVVVLLVVMKVVALALLLGLSAIMIAIAFNGPVTWLEQRRVPRSLGTIALLLLSALIMTTIAIVVGSRIYDEASKLNDKGPAYIEQAQIHFDEFTSGKRQATATSLGIRGDTAVKTLRGALRGSVSRIGQASITLATMIVVIVTWTMMVAYLTIEPRSLLRGMLRISPESEHDAVERVFLRFAGIVRAWLWANLLVGAIEAVLVVAFLTWLEIPAAIVWGALVLFAVFIPKIGAWIMAIPPTLVALAVDPRDAIWVIIFYVVMNEVMSDVVLPRVQSGAIRLRAFYLILFVLAFGGTFGIVGAVIATPIAGFVYAAFDEWILSRRPRVTGDDDRVERMIGAG